MRGKLILFLVLGMFLVSFASALDTEINVDTLKNVKVSILVLDPSEIYLLLNSYHIQSGEAGKVSATYSGDFAELNIRVQITENGKQIMLEKFEGVKAGHPVYIRTFMGGDVSLSYEKEKNDTIVNVSNQTSDALNVTNETVLSLGTNSSVLSSDSGISGSVVSESVNFFIKWKYYLAGGVVLVLIIGFLVFRLFMNNSNMPPSEYTVRKQLSATNMPVNRDAVMSNSGTVSDRLEQQITDSQKRIAELQREVITLKNKERIEAAEKKIEEDRRELERLRNGGI